MLQVLFWGIGEQAEDDASRQGKGKDDGGNSLKQTRLNAAQRLGCVHDTYEFVRGCRPPRYDLVVDPTPKEAILGRTAGSR